MKINRPIVAVTMGDPVGIGPEITIRALSNPYVYKICKPLVLGDINILKTTAKCIKSDRRVEPCRSRDSVQNYRQRKLFEQFVRMVHARRQTSYQKAAEKSHKTPRRLG